MESIRRKQLIDATLESIGEVGYGATTVQSIARRAGVSAGIIAHYFGNKLGLLEATMLELLQQLKVDLLSRLPDEPTPQDRIAAIIATNFSKTQTDSLSAKTWLAFWSSAMHEPAFARLQQINKSRLHSNLRVSFKALGHPDPHLAATSLAALIDGLWLRGALTQEGIDAQQCIKVCRQHVNLVLAAIPAKPQELAESA
jgi:TetR/AcrR family transcriptional repressor of bet genes